MQIHLYKGQFSPIYAQKRRRMGPSGCLCHFDIAPYGGVSAGVAEADNSHHHPTPNARSHHHLAFAISYPATEEEDDVVWSTSSSGSQ